jgi:lysophospholipase L1-like esterase
MKIIRIIFLLINFSVLIFFTDLLYGQVRILPLGNSITDGNGEHNSYRRPLWHMLDSAGFNVDFIGSKNLNGYDDQIPPEPDFDMDHEGHAGWTSSDIMSGPDGWDQQRGTLPEWLEKYTPDIVLLHIGTNDIFNCRSASSILTNISYIINELRNDNPRVIIFLAQILPLAGTDKLGFDDRYCNPSKTLNQLIVELNNAIAASIENLSNAESPVYLVDQYTGIDPDIDLFDGIHPNEAGEVKMAKSWYNKLAPVLDTLQHQSRNYYISPLGSDTGPGTLSNPWKTIDKVNRISFYPGDSILFQGNRLFYGNLIISKSENGDKDPEIIISSYGSGKAIIYGGNDYGIILDNCSNIAVQNLKIMGAGRLSGNTSNGVIIRDCHDISINGLEISGFQHSGLLVSGTGEAIHISNVFAHDNGFAGIQVFGQYPDKYQCKNLYIGYCIAENNPGDPTVLDNHSGNGIIVGVCDSVLIEYCEAFNNGWDMPRKGNGPVGIWAWHADHVLIQHCISHNNKTSRGSSDGGGFDLDGGVANSVVQFCVSYSNEGPGYGLFEYQGANVFENNTIRYNISINDGINGGGVNAALWNGDKNYQNIRNLFFFNNVLYNDMPQGKAIVFYDQYYSNAIFSNNIFLSKGAAISGPLENATFTGNVYWNLGNKFSLAGTSSFEEWVAVSGKEILGDSVVGMNVDPLLYNPGTITITNPKDISYLSLAGFQMLPGSPLRDKGIDLETIYGVNMGLSDLFGDSVPQNNIYDIGIHEYRNLPPRITSSPFTSVLAVNLYRYKPTAFDPNAGDVLKFAADTIPEWLTFNDSSGILTGVPSLNDTGIFHIDFSVSDGQLKSYQHYTMNVKNENIKPEIVSINDTTLEENAFFLLKIKVSDPDTSDRVFVKVVTKPEWLNFIPDSCQLSGTPQREDAGSDSIRIIASDGIDSVEQSFIITVMKINHPPLITSVPVLVASSGDTYQYSFQAYDIDPGDTLIFEAQILPGWLQFNSSSGELSGTPTLNDLGINPVMLLAKDASSIAEQSFLIEVIEPGMAVIINPGFEPNGISEPWKTWTDGGIVSNEKTNIHSGSSAVRLTGYYTYLYQLVDVLPHRVYILKAWINTGNQDGVWFGVKNYGGNEIGKFIKSSTWVEAEISFETGDNPSPAEIYIWKDSGGGSIFVDDFSIQTLNTSTEENHELPESYPGVLYPNPAKTGEKIVLDCNEITPGDDILITVTDISGRCLFRQKHTNPVKAKFTIDLQNLNISPGLYYLSVINGVDLKSWKLIITD